jgi:hypothetical protein
MRTEAARSRRARRLGAVFAYGQVTFGGTPTHAVDGNVFVRWCVTMIAPSPGRPEVEFTAVAVVGGMQNVFTD